MRNLTYALIGATIIAGGLNWQPAAAQTGSPPAQTGSPPAQTGRKCVMAHLPALVAAVREHMRTFRAANVGASQDQIASERRAFIKATEAQHADEVAAAKQACGVGSAED